MEKLKVNPLEPIPNWKLRLQMMWCALTSRGFFFVGWRKMDWSGKGKHKGLHSGSVLPPDYSQRRVMLETLRDTIQSIIQAYDEEETKK